MPDRILAGLTLRQLVIISADALVLWGIYVLVGSYVSPVIFGAIALPLAAAGIAIATATPHGVTIDRLIVAALRYLHSPRRRVLAPQGVPQAPSWAPKNSLSAIGLPLHGIDDRLIDLGDEGSALICRATGLSLGLRAEAEQKALVDGFGRLLNSLDAPVQFVMRACPVDLATIVGDIQTASLNLAHPSLREAAREHASFLEALGKRQDVLSHQGFVVFRERGQVQETAVRLGQKFEETSALLRALGVRLTPLSSDEAFIVLKGACDPEEEPSKDFAAQPGAVIEGYRA